jgi:hypothetical protein
MRNATYLNIKPLSKINKLNNRTLLNPRSPEALRIQAQRWGVAIGCERAEAICVVRNIL